MVPNLYAAELIWGFFYIFKGLIFSEVGSSGV